MSNSIERVYLSVDGNSHALSPLETVADIKAQVIEAARAQGGFVDVTGDAGQRISIFINAATSIAITAMTVDIRARDAADQHGWTVGIPLIDDDQSPYDLI